MRMSIFLYLTMVSNTESAHASNTDLVQETLTPSGDSTAEPPSRVW